jgi:anaerobic selenocysteine-containing dehydrogenase
MDDTLLQESQEDIYKNCINLLPKVVQQSLERDGYYIPFRLNDIPYEDLNFPTFNGKIQIQKSTLELFDPKRKYLLQRGQNELYLISPAHKYFIHSQMGEIHKEYNEDFSKIFLNPSDIELIGLKTKDVVLVSNKFSEGKFIIDENFALKSGTALIYSGLPYPNSSSKNANFFTSEKPEESELSGAYFSVIVKITKI